VAGAEQEEAGAEAWVQPAEVEAVGEAAEASFESVIVAEAEALASGAAAEGVGVSSPAAEEVEEGGAATEGTGEAAAWEGSCCWDEAAWEGAC
jgi:hypothetical protein